MSAAVPTQEELSDLSLACQKIWELDQNRLEPNRDYQINLQVLNPFITCGFACYHAHNSTIPASPDVSIKSQPVSLTGSIQACSRVYIGNTVLEQGFIVQRGL